MNDLLIRDVLIVDGTAATPVRGDVAVCDGRVQAVGKCDSKAVDIVDGEGLALAPGIIDSHTHYDAQITWDPWTTPSVSLGVTTVIMGNCGFTIAPCREADRELTLANLTQVEGMSLEAFVRGHTLGVHYLWRVSGFSRGQRGRTQRRLLLWSQRASNECNGASGG